MSEIYSEFCDCKLRQRRDLDAIARWSVIVAVPGQGYDDRGIAAHAHLEGVTDILDGIEGEADRIRADLLEILDHAE